MLSPRLFYAAALVGALLAATATPDAQGPKVSPGADVVDVQLLAINDFHGNLEPPKGANGRIGTVEAGGVEFLAAQIARLRAESPNTIVVSAGDNIGATPLLSATFHDEPTIEALGEAGLQVSAVGNHELDEGWWELLRMQKGGCHPTDGCQDQTPFAGAAFQYLAANVWLDPSKMDRETRAKGGVAAGGRRAHLLLPASTIREVGGVRIGFIGLTLAGAPQLVKPESTKGLRFTREAAAANRAAAALRKQGVRAIVVLIHEGGSMEGDAYEGCSGFSGAIVPIVRSLSRDIDVVVSGHTHRPYTCTIGTTLLTSAASFGRLVTDIDLRIDRASGRVVSKQARNVIVVRDLPPAADEAVILNHYRPLAGPIGGRRVGAITAPLVRVPSETGETALGSVVADAMFEAAKDPARGAAVAAMTNIGGIRADLVGGGGASGPDGMAVTYAEVFDALPFGNTVVVRTLTGDAIRRLLEQQFDNPQVGQDRFLQVSAGVTYTFDRRRPAGQRVDPASIRFGGEPVQPSARYRVAMVDFVWSGGDGFVAATEGTDPTAVGADVDVLTAYLSAHAPVAPPPLTRIRQSR